MKKLLLLGGAQYLLPVIEEAHKLGLYVITCDYLPDNIAHKHSDEYRNVSIIDKDAVLSTARELGIDGIMSFACGELDGRSLATNGRFLLRMSYTWSKGSVPVKNTFAS